MFLILSWLLFFLSFWCEYDKNSHGSGRINGLTKAYEKMTFNGFFVRFFFIPFDHNCCLFFSLGTEMLIKNKIPMVIFFYINYESWHQVICCLVLHALEIRQFCIYYVIFININSCTFNIDMHLSYAMYTCILIFIGLC